MPTRPRASNPASNRIPIGPKRWTVRERSHDGVRMRPALRRRPYGIRPNSSDFSGANLAAMRFASDLMGAPRPQGIKKPFAHHAKGSKTTEKEKPKQSASAFEFIWWAMRDLNPRPCACKAPALPLRQSPVSKKYPTLLRKCHEKSLRELKARCIPMCSLAGGSKVAARLP